MRLLVSDVWKCVNRKYNNSLIAVLNTTSIQILIYNVCPHGHKFCNPPSKRNSEQHVSIRLVYKYLVLFSKKNRFLIGSRFHVATPITDVKGFCEVTNLVKMSEHWLTDCGKPFNTNTQYIWANPNIKFNLIKTTTYILFD
jgi:hypothetical protein